MVIVGNEIRGRCVAINRSANCRIMWYGLGTYRWR